MSDFTSSPATGPDAGTASLTLLGAQRDLNDGELAQFYRYPDQHAGVWVRANFIASLDGCATADGVTGGLGGAGDRFVFALLRELADVIVVGAGTVRVENYSGAHLTVTQRQQRQGRGQSEVPQLAIITKAGRLNRDMPVFTRTEIPPLVLTCTAAADETRHRLEGLAEVVDCSRDNPEAVDEAQVLASLAARGQRRILTEGGPMLMGALLRRDMLDELCLTIAPYLVSGPAGRIATGIRELMTRMRCAHVLADDAGYLYTRYVKA